MNFSALSGNTLAGKALRLPLRLIPKDVPIPVLRGPLRGRRWIAGSSDHGCWLGSYEYKKQRAFAQALRRGGVVYDLGANVGFYTLVASVLVGSKGLVFAFEPDPANVRTLRRHLDLNGVANCSILEAAVSCVPGHSDFVVGQSSCTGHLARNSEAGFRVETIALDDLVGSAQLPPPNVIKCDIEGSEYEALQGAVQLLQKHAPVIFLATHGEQVHGACCTLLSDLGYRLEPLDGLRLERSSEILARPSCA